MERLSNIELYYAEPGNITNILLTIDGEEAKHIQQVMRHRINDEIFATNGKGELLKCKISRLEKNFIEAYIIKRETIENPFANIHFCIPKLRNPDRLEFAIEKCTELGITNLIIFDANRSVAKGEKSERWNKLLISAIKQSIRTYIPKFTMINSIEEIASLNAEKIILEQETSTHLRELKIESNKKYYFIFGPEGGLDEKEKIWLKDAKLFSLNTHRLRSETAIISAAAIVTSR